MAGKLFDVGVSVYLIDRVSRDLGMLGRSFTGAERRVRALQRSLNDLQTRHQLYYNRVRATQRLERDGTRRLLERKAMLEAATSQQAQAELQRTRNLERAQALQLRGRQRVMALRRVEERQQKDAERLAERRLKISELQGRVNERNTMSQIRRDETANRLARERNDIKERNLELSRAQAAARRERFMAILKRGAIGAAVAAAITAEVIRSGLPIGRYQQQTRLAGQLTQAQAAQLQPLALRIASQTGVFSFKQVMSAFPMLAGMLHSFRLMRQVAPRMFATAAVMSAYGAEGTPAELVGEIARTQRALGARTPAQYRLVNRVFANVYRQTQGAISPENIAETMRQVAPAIVKMPFARGIRLAEQLTLLQGLTGIKGLPELFKELMLPGRPQAAALRGLLHLPVLGRASPQQVWYALTHTLPGLTFPQRLMAGRQEQALLHLQQAMRGGVLAVVRKDMLAQVSVQHALITALHTAATATTTLTRAFESFVEIQGAKATKRGGIYDQLMTAGGKWLQRQNAFIMKHPLIEWYGLKAANLLHYMNPLSILNWAQQHSISLPYGASLGPIPTGVTPTVHVTVQLDGKTIAEATAKHTRTGIRNSHVSHVGVANPLSRAHPLSATHKLTP